MELKQIEAFLMIVEKGTFSAAAEALYITQPTISVRIQHLEEELGRTLFERVDGKRVQLTKNGEKILPYFQQALEFIHQGAKSLKNHSDQDNRILISTPNYMGVEIMPDLLKELYLQFPQFEFEIKISTTNKIIEEVRNGTVDIGIGYIQSSTNEKQLKMIEVANEQNILVSSPRHPYSKKSIITPVDLIAQRIILYENDFLSTQLVKTYLEKYQLKDIKMTEVSNVGWIKMMVRKELGLAFLQTMTVHDELKTGKLIQLPLEMPLPTIPIKLFFNRNIPAELRRSTVRITKSLFQISNSI